MSNPIRSHFISDYGCEVTLLNFLASKDGHFAYYAKDYNGGSEVELYKTFASLAIDPNPKKFAELQQLIDSYVSLCGFLRGQIEEAAKCMSTLHTALTKIDAQLQAQEDQKP